MSFFKKVDHLLWGSEYVIAHKFHKPPWGGGNQFLMALRDRWIASGLDVGANTFGSKTKNILCNSHSFTPKIEKKIIAAKAAVVHRIDGPMSVYGRKDPEIDKKVHQWNRKHATRTVFQSNYSWKMHEELGLDFVEPTVIHNSVSPEYFYRPVQKESFVSRKVRLIADSWSDNPKKGKAVYEWLDQNLDFSKYDFTFVGRVNSQFKNIEVIPPVGSKELGDYLRSADIYMFASQHDSCSNALIEALTCGLPAIYHNSGGSPELVGEAGIGFETAEEIPAALEKIVGSFDQFRSKIKVRSLEDVAKDYLKVFKAARGE